VEHGASLVRRLADELVVVDADVVAEQLLRDLARAQFVDVVLPRRVVTPRQHHVEDLEVLRALLVAARHVAVIAAVHGDLAAQEPHAIGA
jgi:hypothetical protein